VRKGRAEERGRGKKGKNVWKMRKWYHGRKIRIERERATLIVNGEELKRGERGRKKRISAKKEGKEGKGRKKDNRENKMKKKWGEKRKKEGERGRRGRIREKEEKKRESRRKSEKEWDVKTGFKVEITWCDVFQGEPSERAGQVQDPQV
jgi:hypothetical protein